MTPRLLSQHRSAAHAGKLIAGIDIYHSIYDSDRSLHLGDPPIHRYDLNQTTAAAYFQETIERAAGHRLSPSARACSAIPSARATAFDPNAPRCGVFLRARPKALPLDGTGNQ